MSNVETENIETMEDLIPNSDFNIPNLKKGDVVVGKISAVTESHIILSLGVKQDGCAEIGDYLENGKLPYKVGDEIRGFIVRMTDDQITVSKGLNRSQGNRVLIKDAFESHIPVKGKVLETRKGGFAVDVLGIRAFCPSSHIDVLVNEKPETYLNNTYDFQIIENNKAGIIVSRKILLSKEMADRKEKVFANINVGDIVKGRVVRIAKFGVFVDLGGYEGLLHISELSWSHIGHAEEVLKMDEEIDVKVIGMSSEKISLSIKALTDNPLKSIVENLSVDDIVKCKVIRHEKFGSFVQMDDGVEGLIPISQMIFKKNRGGHKFRNPADILKLGDEIMARIIKIDRETLKISLAMQAETHDVWFREIADFETGQVITGVIDNISNFGLFVKVRENVTGLIPMSVIRRAKLNFTSENSGQEIEVRIARIDTEMHRLSLEPLDMPPAEPFERKPYEKKPPRQNRSDVSRPRSDKKPRTDNRTDKDHSTDSDWTKYATNYQGVPEDNPFNDL
jgi:small subunit ribosomal protein S1